MSDKLALIQFAAGKEHEALLQLTRDYHREYCETMNADYRVDHKLSEDPRTGHWRKIQLILDALNDGYDKVIWLDCDAVIVNNKFNIFNLLDFGIGVCECFDSPSVIRHLNTGVIWAVNSAEVRDFMKEWDVTPRNNANGWHDQNAFIQLMANRPHRDLLTILPNRFNCIETHMEARNPIIKHYAGDEARLLKIQNLMKTLSQVKRSMWSSSDKTTNYAMTDGR